MKNLILTTALMALAAPVFAAPGHDGEMAVGMPRQGRRCRPHCRGVDD